MPISPEVLGFTVAEYYLDGGQAGDSTSPEYKAYQPESLSMDYNSKEYFYRLFVKVKNNDIPAYPCLTILAIMYTDPQRNSFSPVLPLIAPEYPQKTKPVTKCLGDYDADKRNHFPYFGRYQNGMGADSRSGYPYYYGILQFNYKFTDDWYDSGILVIEVNIGGGKYEGKVDEWFVTQTVQWTIPNFT